jgi:hypothetical protein
MTAPQRRSRKQLKRLEDLTPKQFMKVLVDHTAFTAIADQMPEPVSHRDRSRGGRPAEYPPVVFLALGVLAAQTGSIRSAVRALADMWDWIRKPLHAAAPGYKGLQRGSGSPSRSQFGRYRDLYLHGDSDYAAVHDEAVRAFADLAKDNGYFDRTGTIADPDISDVVFGDGCVFKARFGLKRKGLEFLGDGKWVDPVTGEITNRPWDPDAGNFVQGDKTWPYGLKYSIIGAHNGHERERMFLNFGQLGVVGNTDSAQSHKEAKRSVDLVAKIQQSAPDVYGLVYDKALRGTHHDTLYQLGMFGISKIHHATDDLPKSLVLGNHEVTRDGKAVGEINVVLYDGAPYMYATAGGDRHLITLEAGKPMRRKNRTTGYRWYRSYTVPCDPRINPELHATTFRLRLDTTDEDTNRKLHRAENLRLHPEGTPAFKTLIALRPVSESLNSWIKNHQVPHRRAPVVGHARMRVHLLFQALYLNIRATIARMLRTGQQLPFTT